MTIRNRHLVGFYIVETFLQQVLFLRKLQVNLLLARNL
jgi:hypothetical protein